MSDKKYPSNNEEEQADEKKTPDKTVLPDGIPKFDPIQAQMMCVYAGPSYWSGQRDTMGVFMPQIKTGNYCSKCGFPYKETDKFCSECGTKIEKAE